MSDPQHTRPFSFRSYFNPRQYLPSPAQAARYVPFNFKVLVPVIATATALGLTKKYADERVAEYQDFAELGQKFTHGKAMTKDESVRFEQMAQKFQVNEDLLVRPEVADPAAPKLSSSLRTFRPRTEVFEGGGGKGGAYPGALKLLDPVTPKNVRGTSVGALTALFECVRASADEIDQASQKLSQRSLFEMNPFYVVGQKDPSVMEEKYLEEVMALGPDFDPTAFLVKETLASKYEQGAVSSGTELSRGVEESFNDVVRTRMAEHPSMRADFDELCPSGDPTQLTLRDIKFLSQRHPDCFSEYSAYLTDKQTGKSVLASAETMPDAPACLVAKASASLPGVFAPTTINGRQYIDGGVCNNPGVKLTGERTSDTLHVAFQRDPTGGVPVISRGKCLLGQFGQAAQGTNFVLNGMLGRMHLDHMSKTHNNVLYVPPGSLGTLTMAPSVAQLAEAQKGAQQSCVDYLMTKASPEERQLIESRVGAAMDSASAELERPEVVRQMQSISYYQVVDDAMLADPDSPETPSALERKFTTEFEKQQQEYLSTKGLDAASQTIKELLAENPQAEKAAKAGEQEVLTPPASYAK